MPKIEPKTSWNAERDEEEEEEEEVVQQPKKEVKKETVRYERVDVTTQTAPAIKNNDTDEIKADVFDILVEVLNKLSRIEKSIA